MKDCRILRKLLAAPLTFTLAFLNGTKDMIEFINVDKNVKVKCDIVGYQFPDNFKDNWCLLRVEIKQGDQVFEKVDPALEANELIELCEWFKCLSNNRLPRYAKLTFAEPCLSFEFLACSNNHVRISVELSHELKPEFELEQFNTKHSEWIIVCELDSKDFEKVIKCIEATIDLYPIRE